MDQIKLKEDLEKLLREMPKHFSLRNALELEARYHSYKAMVLALPDVHPFGLVKSGLESEFADIERHLSSAVRGKPEKKAEEDFRDAKDHLHDDISDLLGQIDFSGEHPGSAG